MTRTRSGVRRRTPTLIEMAQAMLRHDITPPHFAIPYDAWSDCTESEIRLSYLLFLRQVKS